MSWATVRAAIKTELEAVAGITGGAGVVTDFSPHAIKPSDFRTFFGDASAEAVNGWTITRTALLEADEEPGHRVVRTHIVRIDGYGHIATNGSTELAFQDIVDAVLVKLRGNLAVWIEQPERAPMVASARAIDDVEIGGKLCHHVGITLDVEEFILI